MSTIHTIRRQTVPVLYDGRRVRLPLVLPIGSAIQDPDTPQREATQYRTFHQAHDALRLHQLAQHPDPQVVPGPGHPVVAILRNELVLVTNGWMQHTNDLPRVGYVSPPRRGCTRRASPTPSQRPLPRIMG